MQLVQDLDLFLFRKITVRNKHIEGGRPRETNVLIEAFHRGFDSIIDYVFSEGYSNIRAVLKKSNPLEIENQVPPFDTSFFLTHLTSPSNNLARLKKYYTLLVDLMQLSHFLDLFNHTLKSPSEQTRQAVFEFILSDGKFQSLFSLSLEMQKYIFVREVLNMKVADKWMKREPFKRYAEDV